MKRLVALASIFLATVLSTGCATLADAQAAKGAGTVKVYNKPYDVVWNTLIETVKSSGLALVSENKEKGNILAQGGMSVFSYGENVAIFVEAVGGQSITRVEVVSKRAMAANITAADWESRIFEALDKRL